jgi:hypothetical protein
MAWMKRREPGAEEVGGNLLRRTEAPAGGRLRGGDRRGKAALRGFLAVLAASFPSSVAPA